ncbi:MAG: metallopeptidase TldD-related protein [Chloroflexi bacterium]|nr:metallopeptidase TldD-related protein [Chloroflexota bacterium]
MCRVRRKKPIGRKYSIGAVKLPIGRPVSEMNVTGNLKDLFGRLEALGSDLYPYSTTLAPSLVFSDVDFSGA